MSVVASLVLYKHALKDVEKTINCLISEKTISKIVILDNGSHCNWLSKFSHEKIEVLRCDVNAGFGAGHNHAIKMFKSRFNHILVCNPDIYFEQGEFDKLYEFAVNDFVDLSTPKIIYPDGAIQHCCKLLPSPAQLFMRRFLPQFSANRNKKYELKDADYSKVFYAPSISGCFMLLSSNVLDIVGEFDTRYFMYLEDVDLSRRIASAGFKIKYCPYSTVVHESQRRSYKDFKFLVYHLKSAYRYFNKWGWINDKVRFELNCKCLANLPRKDEKEDVSSQ